MRINANNSTKLLCVIGSPIMHSMSPVIHNFMINSLGLNYIYLPFEIKAGGLPEFLSAVRTLNIAGFNATMPHKEALIPLLDEVSEDAAALGAVNTVSFREGRLCGYNTDGEGFLSALHIDGVKIKGKNVMILGAGGAARAVTMALYRAGTAQITVLSRNKRKAAALGKEREDRIAAAGLNVVNLKEYIKNCGLLVNCTPLGMHGTGAEYDDLSFLDDAPEDMAVYDLIYKPARTKFLEYARERGFKTQNGIGMLVHQAILALQIMAGIEIKAVDMSKDIKKILSDH